MANKYFYTFTHEGKSDSYVKSTYITDYWNSLIFDVNHRTIWHQGMPFGNVFPGTASYGEVFNSIDYNIGKAAYSHAEGWKTSASYDNDEEVEGTGAHAEGAYTYAYNEASHAEGYGSVAYYRSHSEGTYSQAYNSSHAEGYYTYSKGIGAHAEGSYAMAFGKGAHAEGGTDNFLKNAGNNEKVIYSNQTFAYGDYSHAEGTKAHANGLASHAEGKSTAANEEASHAEGISTQANGKYSHAEGQGSNATGQGSHAEGNSKAQGINSHAEGQSTAGGDYSHSEGNSTIGANANYSHAEGEGTTISANTRGAHTEGTYTTATSSSAHAEGTHTTAKSLAAHAEGEGTEASGESSHTEGTYTYASGNYSHAEGNNTYAMGTGSHTEGYNTYAYVNANYGHVEGKSNTSDGEASHIEGTNNIEKGKGTNHVQGNKNNVNGQLLNVQGTENNVQGTSTTVIGNSNTIYANTSFVVGASNQVEENKDSKDTKILSDVFLIGNYLTPKNDGEIMIGKYAYSYENGSGNVPTNEDGTNYTIFSIGYGYSVNDTPKYQNVLDVRNSGTVYLYNIPYVWDNGDDKYTEKFPAGLYPIATTSYVMYHGVGRRNYATDKNGNLLYENAEYFNDYNNNQAVANYTHAEGQNTYAAGTASHAEGIYTETYNEGEHASGKYNKSYNGQNGTYTLFTIGNGANTLERKNVFTVLDTRQGNASNGIAFVQDNPIVTCLTGDLYSTTSKATYIWTGKYSDYSKLAGNYNANTLYFVEDGDGSTRDDFLTYNDITYIIDTCKADITAYEMKGLVKNASILVDSNDEDLKLIGKYAGGTSAITTYIWTGSQSDYNKIKETVDKVLADDTCAAHEIVKHMQFIIHPDE